MVPFAGWEMPVQYTGLVDEHNAVRNACGLFDVSHMGELVMSGQYAGAVVNYLVTGDVSRLSIGQALYTCALNERGTFLDDLIVYRAGDEEFLVVCNASNRDKIMAHFRKAAEHHCEFEDQSDRTALIALQGPKSFEVLKHLGQDGTKLAELKSFHFTDAVLGNIRTTAARTGYTGEDGVELFCAWDEAPFLWDRIMEAGAPFGIKPAGLGARDTLRLEARLSLYGNEIDETTEPFEAGLGWIIKMDKGDFVGRAALEGFKANPSKRKMVGFEMTGRGIARHGYPLRSMDEKEVGICTSGSPSPTTGKSIGLGYLPVELAAVGSKFLVDCRGKMIEAVVVKTPFYKRK